MVVFFLVSKSRKQDRLLLYFVIVLGFCVISEVSIFACRKILKWCFSQRAQAPLVECFTPFSRGQCLISGGIGSQSDRANCAGVVGPYPYGQPTSLHSPQGRPVESNTQVTLSPYPWATGPLTSDLRTKPSTQLLKHEPQAGKVVCRRLMGDMFCCTAPQGRPVESSAQDIRSLYHYKKTVIN